MEMLGYRIRNRVLQGISHRSLSTTVLGEQIQYPIGIAPTAVHAAAHPDAEAETARGAAAADTLMVLSVDSHTAIADVSAAAPGGLRWMQTYLFKDRLLTQHIVREAERAGFKALVITVDSPVSGLDSKVRAALNKDAAIFAFRMSNFEADIPSSRAAKAEGDTRYVKYVHQMQYNDSATWEDIRWIKSITNLPIVCKGIVSADSAREAADAGVDGILVSAHGGRQSDVAPAPIDALAEVVDAVRGRGIEVYMDGGIRTGTDVFKALGRGARAVFVGRPILWGLACQGSKGVSSILEILRSELDNALAISGCTSPDCIPSDMVVHESEYHRNPPKSRMESGGRNPCFHFTAIVSLMVYLCFFVPLAFWSPCEDVVTPNELGKNGSHQQIEVCQEIKYGNVDHHTQKAHHWDQKGRVPYPITDLNYFYDDLPSGERAPGHIVRVNSPARTVSVLEPFDSGGCTNHHRATVDSTAKQDNCLVAVNAGFFNPRSGACYGNVVSNGRLVQTNGGLQNAHLGIRADGTLVFGYLSEENVLQTENPFIQLVGGVGWLLRDGEIYVEESKKAECGDTEEASSVDLFFNMLSARVAVGSDEKGRLVIAVIDGQTLKRGLSLLSFAKWLLSHGVTNAINFDGGGSATFVVNGTIVNHPSDPCHDITYRCPRQVSTIFCVHEPRCDPRDCNNHGDCIQGECRCHANWHGVSCDQLQCGDHNCSGQGICNRDGCRCDAGYLPPDCTRTCPSGWYGQDCSYHCDCGHGGSCDPVSGECACLPGYTGTICQEIWDRFGVGQTMV
eukprot:XP_011667235.1 PREDICTED: uncharacterized protein LOC752960 [Strongylocentrotus purpuratus]